MSSRRVHRGRAMKTTRVEGASEDVLELEREDSLELVTSSPVDCRMRELDERGLRAFQVDGAAWLATRGASSSSSSKNALLCDEQGTGKSAQALRANMGRPAIVVCPASLRLAWRDECARWMPSTRVRLAPSGKLPAPSADELVIASFDALPAELAGGAYAHARLIVDEAQKVKSADAERTIRTRRLASCVRSVWVLTGTPMPGTPEDLWSVLELAGLATEAFGSREAFDRAFGATRVRGVIEWAREPVDPAFITSALERVMLRRLRRAVLPELPSKTYEVKRLDVPPELVESLSATDAAWRAIGLDRLPPYELVSTVQRALASSRIPAVLEYLSTRDEPIVLFSAHVEPVAALEQVPGWGTITGESSTMCESDGTFSRVLTERGRARVWKRFQAGELANIALTIGVGGAGLTLTRAWHVVRVSRSYTPAENEQCEDRVVRFGQEAKGVLVTDFVSDHPVEDRLLEICGIKSARIRATVDAAAR